MRIRAFETCDLPEVLRLWNESAAAGEVAYKPLTAEIFQTKFLLNPHYGPEYSLAAEEGGHVIGFINGICKKFFLPKETHENTSAYLTVIFVDKAYRRQGVGTALLTALTDAFSRAGKKTVSCSGNNPVNLPWLVPGTQGHDHNNAPGVEVDCPGYGFLLKQGFEGKYSEVAMYLNLADYVSPPGLMALQAKLEAEGIATGRYDISLGCDFDRMCDRVGSEYWRKVLYDETHAKNPRPILAAVHQGHIVGFTGPVDKEPSGRGWFTGICTDPVFERKGIATVLFNLLMQEFIACGAVFSTLFTGKENHAQRLYLRTGFQVVRRFAILARPL